MLSQICTNIASWQQTPLPASTAPPSFQKWHTFDQDRWMPFVSDRNSQPGIKHQWAGSLRFVTWNVNMDAPFLKSRISALLEVIKTTGAASFIFLQEVSKDALIALLEEHWIQQIWYTSDADASAFGTQKFISVTLVSKVWVATEGILLGAVWRIPLPSRFGRDALCCDMLLNDSSKHTPDHFSFPSARRTFMQLATGSSPATSISFSQKMTTLCAPTILLMRGKIFIRMTRAILGVYMVNRRSRPTVWIKLCCLNLPLQPWVSWKRAKWKAVARKSMLMGRDWLKRRILVIILGFGVTLDGKKIDHSWND